MQQAPHRVQENARPSRYQGDVDSCLYSLLDPDLTAGRCRLEVALL